MKYVNNCRVSEEGLQVIFSFFIFSFSKITALSLFRDKSF